MGLAIGLREVFHGAPFHYFWSLSKCASRRSRLRRQACAIAISLPSEAPKDAAMYRRPQPGLGTGRTGPAAPASAAQIRHNRTQNRSGRVAGQAAVVDVSMPLDGPAMTRDARGWPAWRTARKAIHVVPARGVMAPDLSLTRGRPATSGASRCTVREGAVVAGARKTRKTRRTSQGAVHCQGSSAHRYAGGRCC